MLLANSRRSLFIHDTGMEGNWKPTPGPLIMMEVLLKVEESKKYDSALYDTKS